MNTIPTNTTDNPYKKIIGEVKVSATYDDGGNVIGSFVVWLGDVVAITRRLIEDADPSARRCRMSDVQYTKVNRLSGQYIRTLSGVAFGAWVEQIDGKYYPCVGYGRHYPDIECLYRGDARGGEQTASLYSVLMLNTIVARLDAIGSIEQSISITDDERAKVLEAIDQCVVALQAVQS